MVIKQGIEGERGMARSRRIKINSWKPGMYGAGDDLRLRDT